MLLKLNKKLLNYLTQLNVVYASSDQHFMICIKLLTSVTQK